MNRRHFLEYLLDTAMAATFMPTGLIVTDQVIRLPEQWRKLGDGAVLSLVDCDGHIVSAKRMVNPRWVQTFGDRPEALGVIRPNPPGFVTDPVYWTAGEIRDGKETHVTSCIVSAMRQGKRVGRRIDFGSRDSFAVTSSDTLEVRTDSMWMTTETAA